MQFIDLYHTIAEIAIGILGFTGVLIAVQHNSGIRTKLEYIRLQALITTTITALAASFSPEIFSSILESERTIMRMSNLCLGTFHLSNFIYFTIYGIRNKKTMKSNPFDIILMFSGIIYIVAHFLTFLEIIPWLEFIFITGLLQQLAAGLYQFVKYLGSDDI